MTIVVVAGTGTEIGKTWVTAELAVALTERGIAVVARKPVQSFAPDDDTPTDAEVLGDATVEDPHVVCLAAPLAAARDGTADGGRALEPSRSRSPTSSPRSTDSTPPGAIVLVESVGGVRSPLATTATP